MSWVQVHVSGIHQDLTLDDDAIEERMNQDLSLSDNVELCWAGPGTSIWKRNDNNELRGYGFLSFLSHQGAIMMIEQINASAAEDTCSDMGKLSAELSQPKKKQANKKQTNQQTNSSNLRLRRQRAQPAGKHPVRSSSDKAKLHRSHASV
jgi:hypothetical protein